MKKGFRILKFKKDKPIFEVKDISKSFDGRPILKKLSLKVFPGECVGILGPNGCGKTTLLRAISGFLEPSEGKILIGGQDMSGIRPNKRPTSLIFQNLALFPLMSVADNIAFSLEVRGISKLCHKKDCFLLQSWQQREFVGNYKLHRLNQLVRVHLHSLLLLYQT